MTPPRRFRLTSSPRVRRVVSRVVVVIGIVLAVIGIVTGRLGFLVAGIIVVGLGAAMGPGRIRRD
jgi:type IV secretory pathway VirB2 component (pilin)